MEEKSLQAIEMMRASAERSARHERLCFEAWWEGFKAALPMEAQRRPASAEAFAAYVEKTYRQKREAFLQKIDKLYEPINLAWEALPQKAGT